MRRARSGRTSWIPKAEVRFSCFSRGLSSPVSDTRHPHIAKMSKANRLRTQVLNRAAAQGSSSSTLSGTATSLVFTPVQGKVQSKHVVSREMVAFRLSAFPGRIGAGQSGCCCRGCPRQGCQRPVVRWKHGNVFNHSQSRRFWLEACPNESLERRCFAGCASAQGESPYG